MKYKHIVLGGTFDHLHSGHVHFLKTACEQSEKLTIGLTTEQMIKDKVLSEYIQSYAEREKSLKEFMYINFPDIGLQITPLNDPFGPSVSSPLFDAIVVSEHTHENGLRINTLRQESNLSTLEIITIPTLKAQDGGIISSSRVRFGELDRNGAVYEQFFSKTLMMPDHLREELKKPIGMIINGSESEIDTTAEKVKDYLKSKKKPLVIAVGDIITDSLKRVGYIPNICIIDFKTKRTQIIYKEKSFTLINDHGTINQQFAPIFKDAVTKTLSSDNKVILTVNDEEDLLALPAILLAPLNSIILYGQSGYGVIVVEASEENKKKVLKLIKKFNQ